MQRLQLGQLPPGSSCSAVARSSAAPPDFIVADDGGTRVACALWRRRASCQGEPVRLQEHVLSYCLAGHASGTLRIDGIDHPAVYRPGAAWWLPAGCSAQWAMQSPGEVVHLHLYIAAAALGLPAGSTLAQALHDRWLDGFFQMLAAEHAARPAEGAFERSRFLDDTVALLLCHLGTLLQRPTPVPPATAGGVSPLRPFVLRRIEGFVQAHLAEHLTLERLAAVAQLSVDHFVRAFHQATGTTPHQYLLLQRLERAAHLLRTSSSDVATIAHRCGFASAAHFATTFRRHRGLTPSGYRRQG